MLNDNLGKAITELKRLAVAFLSISITNRHKSIIQLILNFQFNNHGASSDVNIAFGLVVVVNQSAEYRVLLFFCTLRARLWLSMSLVFFSSTELCHSLLPLTAVQFAKRTMKNGNKTKQNKRQANQLVKVVIIKTNHHINFWVRWTIWPGRAEARRRNTGSIFGIEMRKALHRDSRTTNEWAKKSSESK